MRHVKILLAAASLLTLACPSSAADMDEPILVEASDEYVPVEVGSGWYLRGDMTFNADDPVYDFADFGETDHIRFGGGIGFGYHFSDWLRSDITVNYVGGDRFDYNDGVNAVSLSHDMWSGMANGYVDLGTYSGFTPYLGAGAGVLYSKHSVDLDAPDIRLGGSDTQYNFAYALTAGVGYKFTDTLTLDVGYHYLASPDTEYLDTDTLAVAEGVEHHQVRAGLRYNLW